MVDAAPPTPVKIVPDIPAFFADGVISQVYGPGISKFYLGRIDPDPAAVSPGVSNIVAQIIMPAEGFADMVVFFESRLQTMVQAGILTQEYVTQARGKWVKK